MDTDLLERPALATPAAAATRPGRAVAVLQPYLFPYLGTFQLARRVDHFVFFDDVAFIKKGYIHRNAILLNGQAHAFTAPVKNVSQNRTIVQHDYVGDWQPLLSLLRQAYAKAPHFEAVYALVQRVLLDPDDNVARKNARSMVAVFDYLGLGLQWSFASALALGPELRASARVMAVCRAHGATTYVNPIGGRALYSPGEFSSTGLALRFCSMRPARYPQPGNAFVPNLSMLDVLMHCPPEQVLALLAACDLVE